MKIFCPMCGNELHRINPYHFPSIYGDNKHTWKVEKLPNGSIINFSKKSNKPSSAI